MNRFAGLLAPTLFVAAILGVWEAACRLLSVPPYFLPAPSAIVVALARHAPLLFVSAARTLATALTAFGLVCVVAGVTALAAASSPTVERAFRPVAIGLQVTPVVALAPLFVIWAGVEHPERAVIALAAIVAFFPIYSGALAGLKSADPELERLFDLYEASPWQRLARLRVPSSAPHVLEGLKVGLGLALVGAVIAELAAGSGGSEGLAWRISEASHRLEIAQSFAALAALIFLAAALHLLFQAAERAALGWWRGWPR